MTLTAESVVALICAHCESDLRGSPKVQHGDRYLCATCALSQQRRDERELQRELDGGSA